jgi:hypothetical protein
MNSREIVGKADLLASRTALPDLASFLPLVETARDALANEDEDKRPRDSAGRPGGLVLLDPEIGTILVPDIHARAGLLAAILKWIPPGMESDVADLLVEGKLQVVCLGDVFHSEAIGARERWREAYREYTGGFAKSRAMKAEMTLAMNAIEIVLLLKILFPRCFHYLKGNHDNISDEEGSGNHSFGKFACEGSMVALWTARFFGEDFLSAFSALEKEYPLLVKGRYFLASHAEPGEAFSVEDLVEYRTRPEVVEGLTWTANGAARKGSTAGTLRNFFAADSASRLYFGGHRPVDGSYALRAEGAFVQIHNPSRLQIAFLPPDRPADPDRDIFLLG